MMFNKLRKGLLIFGICAMSLGSVACTKEEVKNVDMVVLRDNINTPELMNEMAVMTADPKEHYIFEDVVDQIEDGFMIQAMMNVKLNDVFVVKTSNPEVIKQKIEDYKTNNLRMFGDGYGGEDNITAVANAKLDQVGDYVYFIATPNSDEVEAKLLESLK